MLKLLVDSKALVGLGLFLGTSIGSYIPTFFGAGLLSYWSLFGTLVGGIIGVWLGWKIANW